MSLGCSLSFQQPMPGAVCLFPGLLLADKGVRSPLQYRACLPTAILVIKTAILLVFEVTLVMVFCNNNRKVTKTTTQTYSTSCFSLHRALRLHTGPPSIPHKYISKFVPGSSQRNRVGYNKHELGMMLFSSI